jgi:hypothetical protein
MQAIKSIATIAASLDLVTASWATAQNQQRGPSTAPERAKAVQVAHRLQSDPWSAETKAAREWVVMWLIQVPEISVKLCSVFLGEDDDSKSETRGTLIATMMASEAAFVIEHPDKSKDDVAVYFAGLDGALNAYAAMKKKDSQLHLAQLDDLLAQREQGEARRLRQENSEEVQRSK